MAAQGGMTPGALAIRARDSHHKSTIPKESEKQAEVYRGENTQACTRQKKVKANLRRMQ